MEQHSHNHRPPHVLLAYKNFAANHKVSHIGLGVSALNNAKVLNSHGIVADVSAIRSADDLEKLLEKRPGITHVVISAPWIPSANLAEIVLRWPRVEFVVNCHSNVGFLQADRNASVLLRQYLELQQGTWNFRVAGNSAKFVQWLRAAFQVPCTYLPNMYAVDYSTVTDRPLFNGGILRLGAFGATRPQKNLMSAAAAALQIHEELKTDTEFWVSGGRTDGGGNSILEAVRGLCSGIPGFTLRESDWATWPNFRALVRQMNLLIQVSYTESFNMVTADGVAVGVPTVASEAITWVPSYWHADFDNVCDIARVGRQLLIDPQAPKDGLMALEAYNRDSFDAWRAFIKCKHSEYNSQVRNTLHESR